MTSSTGDLRLALRGLRRSPLFSIVAILSLALGIGANTAIFTLIDQMLLRKLPVQAPEQLVMLYQRGSHNGSNMGTRMHSYPIYQDLQKKRGAAVGGPVPTARRRLGQHRQPDRARRRRDGLGQLLHDARRQAGDRPGLQLAGRRPGLSGTSQRRPQLRLLDAADSRAIRAVIGKKILVNNYPMIIVGVSAGGFAGHRSGAGAATSACRS